MYEQLPDKSLPPVTYAPREPRLRRPPFIAISAIVILACASWIPLVYFARARVTPSTEPRVQYEQDMGTQPKYREQQSSTVFADGRADRLPIPGTVARGKLMADDGFFRGFNRTADTDGRVSLTFLDSFPKGVNVDAHLLARGQQRFNIYCSPCHGLDGSGEGPVHKRAAELGETKWVPPANLHSDTVRGRAIGHIFNTITVGIRNMPGYGQQIPPQDRWAIVAYVRALQLTQNAPPSLISQNTSK